MFSEVMSFQSSDTSIRFGLWLFFTRVALGALFDAVLVRLEVVLESFCGILCGGMASSAWAGEWRDFEDRPVGLAVVIGMS